MTSEKTARIAALNDRLRQTHLGGVLFMTAGVNAFGLGFQAKALRALAAFDQFDPEDDPYGEHDFGAMTVEQRRLFWKIEYLDATLTLGADDPSDEHTCTRVLTLMLVEEY